MSLRRVWLLPLVTPLGEPLALDRERLSAFVHFLRAEQVEFKCELVDLLLLRLDCLQVFTFYVSLSLQFVFKFLNLLLTVFQIKFELVITFFD